MTQSDSILKPASASAPAPNLAPTTGQPVDLFCFSHLPWGFVYQRPQHLMSRAARAQRVFYVEEARAGAGPPRLAVTRPLPGLRVVTPYLEPGLTGEARHAAKRQLLAQLWQKYGIAEHVLWYCTPAALTYTRQLNPVVTVYDCLDDLAAFDKGPRGLKALEQDLLRRADLVFTGSRSLFDARREQHPAVYLFPNAVEREHFAQARSWLAEPADQDLIPRPRLGFFGVLDERLDLALLDGLAAARPAWQVVMVGPVAKTGRAALPRRPNIHYLGQKPYADLPAYLAGWDVAIMPFAVNEATRNGSPARTPEFLAAGKPVVSTTVCDVVRPYGELELVRLADTVPAFVAEVEAAMADGAQRDAWLRRVDNFLAQHSWDHTWQAMARLVTGQVTIRQGPAIARARIAQAHVGELLYGEFSPPLG